MKALGYSALLGALALSFWLGRTSGLPDSPPADPGAGQAKPAIPKRPSRTDGHVIRDIPFFVTDSMIRGGRVHDDDRAMDVYTIDTVNGEQDEYATTFSVSFEIEETASQSASVVFVCGAPDGGGTVVEQWSLQDTAGGQRGDMVVSDPATGAVITPQIGVPTPPAAPSVTIVGGGTFVARADRSRGLTVSRSVVVQEPTLRQRAFGVDPEGRFILVLFDNGELRKYFLDGQTPFVVLTDIYQTPALEHVVGVMSPLQHQVLGRVWSLSWYEPVDAQDQPIPFDQYETVLLYDSDNDGLFESIETAGQADADLEFVWDGDYVEKDYFSKY